MPSRCSRRSRVPEVVVVGRRGPAQAAFTNPELLELGELSDADVIVDAAELERALAVHDAAAEADITSRRNVEILRSYAEREPAGHPKRVVLRFLLSPSALLAGQDGRLAEWSSCATSSSRARTAACVPRPPRSARRSRRASCSARSATAASPAGRALRRALGNDSARGGRVLDVPGGSPLPGEYVVGWIKRGPSGVIGTNKKDAQETVDAILADLEDGHRPLDPVAPDADAVEGLLRDRQPDLVTYAGWSEIDRHERALGEPSGRPRVKLTRIDEMLRIAAAEEAEG